MIAKTERSHYQRDIPTIECVWNRDGVTQSPHSLFDLVAISISTRGKSLPKDGIPEEIRERFLRCLKYRPSEHKRFQLQVMMELEFCTQGLRAPVPSVPIYYASVWGRSDHDFFETMIWGSIDTNKVVGGCKRFWTDCLDEHQIAVCQLARDVREEMFKDEDLDRWPNCFYFVTLEKLREKHRVLTRPSDFYPSEAEVRDNHLKLSYEFLPPIMGYNPAEHESHWNIEEE